MNTKIRQTVSLICCALGLILLLYGTLFHLQSVSNKDGKDPTAMQESQLVLEASRGGLHREQDGSLRLTYSGKPPAACPT